MGVVRVKEQFLHCGLWKFRHSKSSVYRWYTQLDRRRFVYDTWDNGSRLGRVMVECTLSITYCLRLNLQLHTIDLARTCRISSFCTVAWQLARFQLTRRIVRSLSFLSSKASSVFPFENKAGVIRNLEPQNCTPNFSPVRIRPFSYFQGWKTPGRSSSSHQNFPLTYFRFCTLKLV